VDSWISQHSGYWTVTQEDVNPEGQIARRRKACEHPGPAVTLRTASVSKRSQRVALFAYTRTIRRLLRTRNQMLAVVQVNLLIHADHHHPTPEEAHPADLKRR